MKKSGGDRLKYAINGSTLSTAARSPFPDGEGKKEAASPHLLEDRLKYAVCESTRAPLARLLPVSSFRAKARNLFCLRLSRRCGDSGIPDT